MKDIEEINSYDDIETYYDVQIPNFIQGILENRVEALKHCVNYKKEIERLNNIIKDINKTLEDNYGGLPIVEYERLIDLTKGSELIMDVELNS